MADEGGSSTASGSGLAASRSRREKRSRPGAMSELEKLRELKQKGVKHKAEDEDVDNVFDLVDEREYAKRVQKRQEEDWVVDDMGIGYADDGREIFDEELDDLDEKGAAAAQREKKRNKEKEKMKGDSKGKSGSIYSMLMNMPKKKTDSAAAGAAKLDDDAILSEVMEDIIGFTAPTSAASSSRISAPSSSSIGGSSPGFGSPVTPVPTMLRKKSRLTSTPLPERSTPSRGPVTPDLTPLRLPSKRNPFATTPTTPSLTSPASSHSEVPRPKPKRLKVDSVLAAASATEPDLEDTFAEEDADLLNQMEVNLTDELEKEGEMVSTPSAVRGKFEEEDDADKTKQLRRSAGIRSFWGGTAMEGESDAGSGAMEQPGTVLTQAEANEKLTFSTNDAGEKVLRMFWLDAFEEYQQHFQSNSVQHQQQHGGNVYLFGKVWIEEEKKHVSACCIVRNIERRLFLLPRETHRKTKKPVSVADVYQEFNDMSHKYFKARDFTFRSRKIIKKYAFELEDVPPEAEYLEVLYLAKYGFLPADLTGDTFSRIFGSQTSSLERFLLDARLKGPSWLEIRAPTLSSSPVSWCAAELSIPSLSHLSVLSTPPPPPPFSLLCLSVRTAVNASTLNHEIVAIAALKNSNFPLDKAAPKPAFDKSHWIAVSKPSDSAWPYDLKTAVWSQIGSRVEKRSTEKELLACFLKEINLYDPDILLSYDLSGFDLEVILHRMAQLKVPRWDKIGRLKRSALLKLPTSSRLFVDSYLPGRLLCDLHVSAKELIRSKSYDLPTLCEVILAGQQVRAPTPYTADKVRSSYFKTSDFFVMLTETLEEAACVLNLICELNALPLALQITNVAGNLMGRTLLGGRSERIDWLLLHAFYERGFIVPDKRTKRDKVTEMDATSGGTGNAVAAAGGKRKPAYTGGLVLDPLPGLYDSYILLMDFNSLYPSIIQEFNICFTTVARGEGAMNDPLSALPSSDSEPGILPNEIRKLVESRRAVKQLLKDPNLTPDLALQYDIRQKALKLTANSMYGCLGFTHSRFYAPVLAALTTAKGRETLLQAKEVVQRLNFRVIYGDTDSLMVSTNSKDFEQVFSLGKQIKSEVNRLYRLLELDIDGVFASMLLLKKKKYAALTVSRDPKTRQLKYDEELKGLDIVRRDWSTIACDVGKVVVSKLLDPLVQLEDKMDAIMMHLATVAKDLKETGKIPVEKLTITKQLTKDPEAYADSKNQPHVQVALRNNAQPGSKRLRSGDTVEYIICKDGTSNSPTQRAYSIAELHGKPTELSLDLEYYLAHQILPVVRRLLEPVESEGTDATRLASVLGLDPTLYGKSHIQGEDLNAVEEYQQAQDRFASCEKLVYTCSKCACTLVLDDVLVYPSQSDSSKPMLSLTKCASPSCSEAPYSNVQQIKREVVKLIRRNIKEFISDVNVCSDCGTKVQYPLVNLNAPVRDIPCDSCHKGTLRKVVRDRDLSLLLQSLLFAFDFKKALERLPVKERGDMENMAMGPIAKAYAALHQTVSFYMTRNQYSRMDLRRLFCDIFRLAPAVVLPADEEQTEIFVSCLDSDESEEQDIHASTNKAEKRNVGQEKHDYSEMDS